MNDSPFWEKRKTREQANMTAVIRKLKRVFSQEAELAGLFQKVGDVREKNRTGNKEKRITKKIPINMTLGNSLFLCSSNSPKVSSSPSKILQNL